MGDKPSLPTANPLCVMELHWPSLELLPGCVAALETGWSPDNIRADVAAREELGRIAKDPAAYVAGLVDREAKGAPVTLPDGSTVPRLPGVRRWMWDGEFCGVISLRWQRGTNFLPAYCLGHIGYAVVPWKRRQGYAKQALRQMLPEARAEGLACVEITTDPANLASQRVIEASGGVLAEYFIKPSQYGGGEGLRYRIALGS